MSGGFGPSVRFGRGRRRCHGLHLLEQDSLGFLVQLEEQLLDLRCPAVAVDLGAVRDFWIRSLIVVDQVVHGDMKRLGQRGELWRGGDLDVVLVTGDEALRHARYMSELDLSESRFDPGLFESCTDAHLQRMWVVWKTP